MIHWLLHVLGIDTQQSRWYDFWSGIGTNLALVAAAVTVIRRHLCQVRWCARVGRYRFRDADGVDRALCWKHHPGVQRRQLSRAKVREFQQRHRLYAGRQPGRG